MSQGEDSHHEAHKGYLASAAFVLCGSPVRGLEGMVDMNGLPTGPRPHVVAWEATRACNLACRHCRASAQTEPAPDELTTQEITAVIDDIAAFARPVFIISGGEPLMRADIFEVARYGRERGLRVVMSPNGTLITPQAARQMAEAGIARISVSIDGSCAERHDRVRGVPRAATANTAVVPYNDLGAVEALFQARGEEIAAVIVEPVAGNMGVVAPEPGFLEGLRRLTRSYGALLVFDEVMTGFRVALGGAQALYGVDPDLTTLGKVIGGGLPVGACAGKREIMQMVAPAGPVYQAGTLAGNPLAMAAGLATLGELAKPGVFEGIARRTRRLCEGFAAAARAAGVPIHQACVGTMFCHFFTPGPVVDYATARRSDTARFSRFFHGMLQEGVYLAPSQFEAGFMSAAHDDEAVEATVAAAERVLRQL